MDNNAKQQRAPSASGSADRFTKALEMNDLALAKKANRLNDVGVVDHPEDVVVSGTRFLFRSHIFRKVGNRIAFRRETERIERKTGGSWVTVEGKDKESLTETGQILTVLPVYDDAGNPITYRFKETLPTGWHDPKNASAKVMYSEEFDLVYYLGKPTGEAKEIVMQNDRNGSLALTKQFYRMNGSGQHELQQAQKTTFTLYRKTEKGQPVLVKLETFTGSTAFVDLPRTDEQKQPYEYYLVETLVAGYAADTSGTVPLQIGGQSVSAWGPYTFVAEGDKPAVLSQSAVVSNYATALPVVIKKADSITGAFVSGAAFEIDEYDGGIDGQKVVEETSITSSAGRVVYLEGGKQYVVEESTEPKGYTNVTEAKDVIIDLSAYTSPEKAKDYKVITITLRNRPAPRLNVVKHLTGSENPDNPKVLTGVTFEVYSKTGEETFEQVNGYDGQLLTLSSGTAKQLPAGTYYLKEIVPQDNPNQILDPNRHSGEYTGKGEQADDAFYFGPVEVPEVTSEATLTTTYTVENLSSLGAVRVTKYALGEDEQKTPLAGATLAIYQEGKTEALQKKISASETGLVMFTNLPIYDDNDEKIKYTIREIEAPEGYTLAPEELTVNVSATLQLASGYAIGQVQTPIQQAIENYMLSVRQEWATPVNTTSVEYQANVYVARIVAAIVSVPGVVNATNVQLNGGTADLILTETGATQQVPITGTVTLSE